MPRRARRIVVALIAVAAACAVGARIYYVDSTAVRLPEEHYAMNQWVDLDGAFLENRDVENTQGYSIKVSGARVMSYNDYIRQFGTDKSQVKDGADVKNVLDLRVELRNKGNDQGAFFLFQADLVPARKDNYLVFNGRLWHESEPNQDASNLTAKLKPDSEYATDIPYQMNVGYGADDQVRPPLTDTSFELIVSNSPVRKVIDIQVQEDQ